MSVNTGYPDLSALEQGNAPSAPPDDTRVYPDFSDGYHYEDPQHRYGHYPYVEEDDPELIILHSESTICWALVWMCVGFVFWPCFIISFLMIRPVRRDLSNFSHQYCKVMTIYGIDVAGMVLGTIGTVIAIIEIVYTYAR